jgi:hypothetical protein
LESVIARCAVVLGSWLTPVGISVIDRKILAKVGFCAFFGRIMVAYSLFFQLS